jgi:hypothetical protein
MVRSRWVVLTAVIRSRVQSPAIRGSVVACRGTMFTLCKLNCTVLYHYPHYGLFILLYTGSDFRFGLLERSSSREGSGIHRLPVDPRNVWNCAAIGWCSCCHGDGEAT